jgi:hypothetical protein
MIGITLTNVGRWTNGERHGGNEEMVISITDIRDIGLHQRIVFCPVNDTALHFLGGKEPLSLFRP